MQVDIPRSPPETLSKNEEVWWNETYRVIGGVTFTRKAIFLAVLHMTWVAHNGARTVLDSYESDLDKPHDREPQAVLNALIRMHPDFWKGYPSVGPREGSEASKLPEAEYRERIEKARIGKAARVFIRGGKRGYAKPNLRGSDGSEDLETS